MARAVTDGEFLAGRLPHLTAEVKRRFQEMAWRTGYVRTWGSVDLGDLSYLLHEYFAAGVLKINGITLIGQRSDPDGLSDQPEKDDLVVNWMLHLMKRDLGKLSRDKAKAKCWPIDDGVEPAHAGVDGGLIAAGEDWDVTVSSELPGYPASGPVGSELGDRFPTETLPMKTAFAWYERYKPPAEFDPLSPGQRPAHGIGSTALEVDLVRSFARVWREREHGLAARPRREDEAKSLKKARIAVVHDYIERHSDHFHDSPGTRDNITKVLDRGLHRIAKMLYVLGGLGPVGALLTDEACAEAVARFAGAFKTAQTRVSTQLGAQRKVIDFATGSARPTSLGARVVAAKYEHSIQSQTTRAKRDLLDALAKANPAEEATEPLPALHAIEHATAGLMTRELPDCVLWNQCPERTAAMKEEIPW
jgi:hypothetical protein